MSFALCVEVLVALRAHTTHSYVVGDESINSQFKLIAISLPARSPGDPSPAVHDEKGPTWLGGSCVARQNNIW